MQIFKYSLTAKIIYCYANIPISLILIVQLVFAVIGIFYELKFLLPVITNLLILFFLNRYYIKIYRLFPFKIQADNKEMICSDFMIANKIIKIRMDEITNIKGGIFKGRSYSPIYLITKDNTIGISPHIKDYNKLLTIILSNIKKELYLELLKSIKGIS